MGREWDERPWMLLKMQTKMNQLSTLPGQPVSSAVAEVSTVGIVGNVAGGLIHFMSLRFPGDAAADGA